MNRLPLVFFLSLIALIWLGCGDRSDSGDASVSNAQRTVPPMLFPAGSPLPEELTSETAALNPTTATAAGNTIRKTQAFTLAVIPKSTGGEFWETVGEGAREAEKALGVTIKWEGTVAETEIAEQNKIIENMVNLGVDGVALAPLNEKALRKAVENTAQAGIPVVIFDSGVEGNAHVSFVATDNLKGGEIGAEHMIKLLGDPKGRKIMVLRYVQGSGSTEARAKGFIDAIKAAEADVVADPYPEDGAVAGAKRTATNTLEGFVANGELKLDGLFACNLYTALGMAAALDDLRKSGVKVQARFIGFDTSSKLVEDLQAGTIDALVAQNPKRMGYLAVETLTKHLRGEQVPAVIDTGVQLITAEGLKNDPAMRQLVGMK